MLVCTPSCKVTCRGRHRGEHLLEVWSLVADAAVRSIAICPGFGSQGAETDEQADKVWDGLDASCDVQQLCLSETGVAGIVEQFPPIDGDEFTVQIILQLGGSNVRNRFFGGVRQCSEGRWIRRNAVVGGNWSRTNVGPSPFGIEFVNCGLNAAGLTA